jgi:Fe-Mn family superoxide dismutase
MSIHTGLQNNGLMRQIRKHWNRGIPIESFGRARRMTIRSEKRAVQVWDNEGGQTTSNSGNSPVSEDTELFVAKSFQIPELKGISARNIHEHLELYEGYVESANRILSRIRELPKDEEHSYELSLLQRQFAYEHGGMTHHEMFFEQFEGGPSASTEGGPFLKQVEKDFGNFGAFTTSLKSIAQTRGIGWVMLYACPDTGHLTPHWIDEHHIGMLSGLRPVLALDMWEHAFVYDYTTRETTQYVEALFQNLSWQRIEARFGK